MGRAFEYRKAAKMKRWGNMSRIFPKLAKAIEMAAKSGVADPEMNSALRTAILNAKAENMPKTNIDDAFPGQRRPVPESGGSKRNRIYDHQHAGSKDR